MITEFLSKLLISKYPHVTSNIPVTVNLLDELYRIRNGHYKDAIIKCRHAYEIDKKDYKKLKGMLPTVTFSGTFNGMHKAENLIHYNNLIIIDLDDIPKNKIPSLKSYFFQDPYIITCWISPSGYGLKMLLKIQSSEIAHKFYFSKIQDYLYANYSIEIDTTGSDISRLCYVSYDEDLWIKEAAQAFPIHEDEWLTSLNIKTEVKLQEGTRTVSGNVDVITQAEKILFYKTEDRNNRLDREMAKKITTYLSKKGLSITENYRAWIKVGFAIANSFTFDIGKAIFLNLCRLDGDEHDEYKSENQLKQCYIKRKLNKVNFSSIIFMAKEKGFKVNYIQKG